MCRIGRMGCEGDGAITGGAGMSMGMGGMGGKCLHGNITNAMGGWRGVGMGMGMPGGMGLGGMGGKGVRLVGEGGSIMGDIGGSDVGGS